MSRREGSVFEAWTIVLGLFGLGNVANGLWMIVDSAHGYHTLPAGVPDSGPLNQHFVRDIGCIYLLLGMALVGGERIDWTFRGADRRPGQRARVLH